MVILSYVKKTVGLQSEGLVNLKVKADGSHDRSAKVFS
jgi:hypothetical protein